MHTISFALLTLQKLHLEMLEDRPRTLAYRKAVELGAEYIRDKAVL